MPRLNHFASRRPVRAGTPWRSRGQLRVAVAIQARGQSLGIGGVAQQGIVLTLGDLGLLEHAFFQRIHAQDLQPPLQFRTQRGVDGAVERQPAPHLGEGFQASRAIIGIAMAGAHEVPGPWNRRGTASCPNLEIPSTPLTASPAARRSISRFLGLCVSRKSASTSGTFGYSSAYSASGISSRDVAPGVLGVPRPGRPDSSK